MIADLPPSTKRIFEKLTYTTDNSAEIAGVVESLRCPTDMPSWVFGKLQHLEEQMELDVAQGRDSNPNFEEDHREVCRLLDAAPWTMHPDHGCVLAADVPALDRRDALTPQG